MKNAKLLSKLLLNKNPLHTLISNLTDEIKSLGSPTLNFLADKIERMCIDIGSPISVIPMLRSIVKGTKHLSQGVPGYNREPLGKGHFRWNWKSHTLNDVEINHIKKILKELNADNFIVTACNIDFALSYSLSLEGAKFPFDNKSTSLVNKFKFKVLVKNKAIYFDFYGSINDYNNGKVELDNSDLQHALYCFVSDACSAIDSFENFCNEFGYDTDSMIAERIYKSCGKQLEKYNKLTSADIYDVINTINC